MENKFTKEDERLANYIRNMLFERAESLTKPKSQNNNNEAITTLEKMMSACEIETKARIIY